METQSEIPVTPPSATLSAGPRSMLPIILVTIIIVAFIIGAGAYWLRPSALISSPSPSPSDKTGNWLTYNDAQVGMTFKYPSNCSVSAITGANESLLYPAGDHKGINDVRNLRLTNCDTRVLVYSNPNDLSVKDWNDIYVTITNTGSGLSSQMKPIAINGQEAIKGFLGCCSVQSKAVVFSKNHYIYLIYSLTQLDISEDRAELDAWFNADLATSGDPLSQIVSTFQISSATTPSGETVLEYRNNQYGLSVKLPSSWQGYKVQTSTWQGTNAGQSGDKVVATGPAIHIVHPFSTTQNPRQDIPIMVFTIAQWNAMQADQWHVGAAPFNPSELARNSKYVFGLPARYNYAFLPGYEEVQSIIDSGAITAF